MDPKQQHELAQKYLKDQGARCPFCGSEDVEGGFVEIDCRRAYQKVRCNACNQAWHDGYTLDSVMFEADEGEEFIYKDDPPPGPGPSVPTEPPASPSPSS